VYRIRNGLVAIPASAYLNPATAHTRGSETKETDPVQYKHIQPDSLSYCNLPVEYFTGRRLPTAARQLQSSTELSPADVNAHLSYMHLDPLTSV